MQEFELLKGAYAEGTKLYSVDKGDTVVKSEKDLVALFGEAMFAKVVAINSNNELKVPQNAPRDDVTSEFGIASEYDMKVVKKGEGYKIFQGEEKTSINPKWLAESEVVSFIENFIKE